jgi:hypothetical protein
MPTRCIPRAFIVAEFVRPACRSDCFPQDRDIARVATLRDHWLFGHPRTHRIRFAYRSPMDYALVTAPTLPASQLPMMESTWTAKPARWVLPTIDVLVLR